MRSLLSDVKYWFSRAEEVRTIAEAVRDPEAARIMAEITKGYDRLAARAAEREGSDIYKL